MGACFSTKNHIAARFVKEQEMMIQKISGFKPLFTLKQELLQKLNITDEHFFSVFCTYRFKHSVRADHEFQRIL